MQTDLLLLALTAACRVHPDIETVLFEEGRILERVREMGAKLAHDYRDREPLILGVLTGAVLFTSGGYCQGGRQRGCTSLRAWKSCHLSQVGLLSLAAASLLRSPFTPHQLYSLQPRTGKTIPSCLLQHHLLILAAILASACPKGSPL
jgi:hypothetical protein